MKSKYYYHQDIAKLINRLVPSFARSVTVKENNSKLLKPKRGVYDYLILNNIIGDLEDIQGNLEGLLPFTHPKSRLVLIYYNHLWEPILRFATFMGWRKDVGEQSWVDNGDIKNILNLAGYETITQQKRLLLPIEIPVVTKLVNGYLGYLPLINELCLTTWTIARPVPNTTFDNSISIVIAAKNEEGNIPSIIPKIPKFGKSQEIIFVEGHSTDNTWAAIKKEVKKKRPAYLTVKAFKQKGKGKADAVRLGFAKSSGDVLMILDADMTMPPRELAKFYDAISQNKGEFINGSRLVYPMEDDAMRVLNKFGNKLFSLLFSWILGQRFKDTLCGTKVLFREDYQKIVKGRKYFGDFDPFGDFDLIFGAMKLNLKSVDLPIRYKERIYGSTNISRFRHGLLLAKMTLFAFRKFNF